MEDGEEFHIFNEEPLRFTEEGMKNLIDSGMYTIGYDPYDMEDLLLTGMEIFHVGSEGIIKRIPVMSKEGQELLDKLDEERL